MLIVCWYCVVVKLSFESFFIYPLSIKSLYVKKDNSKIIIASIISYKPGIKPIPKDAKANLLTHFHPCFLIILFSSFSIICNNSSFSYS